MSLTILPTLTLTAAENGGIIVSSAGFYDVSRDRLESRSFLYAGSLTDCLEFMLARMADLPPPASDVRKAA